MFLWSYLVVVVYWGCSVIGLLRCSGSRFLLFGGVLSDQWSVLGSHCVVVLVVVVDGIWGILGGLVKVVVGMF